MTAQCIGCYQDTVFSGDFIAKEVYGVGDRGQEIPQLLMYRHAWRAVRTYP